MVSSLPGGAIAARNGVMALGTLLGGWRIVRTMDLRITRLTPFQGVCAENAGSITLLMATDLGIAVSTTHAIPGAITRVGAARIGGLAEGGATNCYRLGDHNADGGGKGALSYGGASLVR